MSRLSQPTYPTLSRQITFLLYFLLVAVSTLKDRIFGGVWFTTMVTSLIRYSFFMILTFCGGIVGVRWLMTASSADSYLDDWSRYTDKSVDHPRYFAYRGSRMTGNSWEASLVIPGHFKVVEGINPWPIWPTDATVLQQRQAEDAHRYRNSRLQIIDANQNGSWMGDNQRGREIGDHLLHRWKYI